MTVVRWPAPGRGYVSAGSGAFLLLLLARLVRLLRARRLLRSDGQRSLHPEGRVVAHGADELVVARPERRLPGLRLAGAEDRRPAEVLPVLLDVQVVRERAVVPHHEAHHGRLGRAAVHDHVLRLELVLRGPESDRLVVADRDRVLVLHALVLLPVAPARAPREQHGREQRGGKGPGHGGG